MTEQPRGTSRHAAAVTFTTRGSVPTRGKVKAALAMATTHSALDSSIPTSQEPPCDSTWYARAPKAESVGQKHCCGLHDGAVVLDHSESAVASAPPLGHCSVSPPSKSYPGKHANVAVLHDVVALDSLVIVTEPSVGDEIVPPEH